MANKCFLSILLIQLHLLEINSYLVPMPLLSKNLDLIEHIEYTDGHQCLQIALNTMHQIRHVLVVPSNLPVRIWSHAALKLRDISTDQEAQCETFLIFVEDDENVERILRSERSSVKQFFPYTKIYIHFEIQSNNTARSISESVIRKFLIENALFGYVLQCDDKHNESTIVVNDLLANDASKNMPLSYVPKQLLHPAVDINLHRDNFRISLFDCAPYTIYPELEMTDDKFVDEIDGTEFRLVKELTKNWKKSFKFRDFALVKYNPYAAILQDLSNQESDLAMCALWLMEDTHRNFDLSSFYEDQCLVLLVPKPMKLDEATAIYTTLDTYVWLLFLFFFLWSIVSLNVVAKVESQLNGSSSIFIDFTVTVMEIVGTATSHSVTHFPNDQLSVKIILMSWILLSLWLGICYTTIYASRLSKPSYEKPINTVRQVLDHDLYVCNAYFDVSTMVPLRESINADHRELGNRSLVYGEDVQYRRQVLTERKCAVFEARVTNYIPVFKFRDDTDLLPLYRTFKSCVVNHYTGFVFQKYSPYSKLFSWYIQRYQEHGFIDKWETDILKTPLEVRTLFDDYPEQSLRPLSIINVSGAFILLGAGLVCSGIVFFVELVKYRRSTNNKTKKNPQRHR